MGFPSACGIDFGTSNSTVSLPGPKGARLLALEGAATTLPSAVFWEVGASTPVFGRAALDAYTGGDDGRLMRGLKSALGSDLIHEKTRIGNRALAFTDILGTFIGHLKLLALAEAPALRHVVLGRPVHFVDDDAAGNSAAQSTLEKIARDQGFDEVAFQYEPIAAALDYESRITTEDLVLIVDIGGGTSDFSVVRVSPDRARAPDRAGDILGNHGIRVGGTDFDRLLSLARVMPQLGLGSEIGGKLPMPLHYFHDLATWHRINALYSAKTITDLRQIKFDAARPDLLDRLIHVLDTRAGHALAMAVEAAKIDLSDQRETALRVADLFGSADIPASRAGFEAAVDKPVTRIMGAIAQVLAQAGVAPRDIGTVFMTGGSSSLPVMQAAVGLCLPGVAIATGDLLGSVGLGLALDAKRQFG